MADEHAGTLEAIGLTVVTISGKEYSVPEYVQKYLARRKPGEQVLYTYSSDAEGGRTLTKIMLATKPPARGGKGQQQPQGEKRVTGILKALTNPNITVTTDGGDRTYYVGKDKWVLVEGFKVGDRVEFAVNTQGNIGWIAVVTGIDQKPPVVTGAEIKAETAENKDSTQSAESGPEPETEPEKPDEREEPARPRTPPAIPVTEYQRQKLLVLQSCLKIAAEMRPPAKTIDEYQIAMDGIFVEAKHLARKVMEEAVT